MENIVQAIDYIILGLVFAAGVTLRDLLRLLGWMLSKLETSEQDIMEGYTELKEFRKGKNDGK